MHCLLLIFRSLLFVAGLDFFVDARRVGHATLVRGLESVERPLLNLRKFLLQLSPYGKCRGAFHAGDICQSLRDRRSQQTSKMRLLGTQSAASSVPCEVGKIYYDCKIKAIVDYGMFVEVTPGKQALLHISQITANRLESMEEAGFKVGDVIDVKVERRDGKGNFVLSRNLTNTIEVGKTYRDRKVTVIRDIGMFVEIVPGIDALFHVRKLTRKRLQSFKEGDLIDVKVTGLDSKGCWEINFATQPEVGTIYRECKVTGIQKYGVFVEVTPGYQALLQCNISGFKVGNLIDVKVVSQDAKGNFRLSRLGLEEGRAINDTVDGKDDNRSGPVGDKGIDAAIASSPQNNCLIEIGKTYHDCKIIGNQSYGVFVEVTPGCEELLHFSETTTEDKARFKVGDLIDVKVKNQDANGNFRLTRLGLFRSAVPPELGKIYRDCRITIVESYGVNVEVTPGYQGFLHMDRTGERFKSTEEAGFKVGDFIDVRVEREDGKGRFILSGVSTSRPQVGKIYRNCKIMKIHDFGAFVEVTPGAQALLHVTETSSEESASFKVGDLIDVKVVSQDSKGNFRLSRLGLLGLSAPPKIGKTYRECKIMSIHDYGAFVEVTPGHQALLHISQITGDHLNSMEESGLKEGDVIDVRVYGIGSQGNLRLTRAGPGGPPSNKESNVAPAPQPLEVGKTYGDCKITSIHDFGMFVELTPGNEALFHVRKLTPERMKTFKKGDLIDVMVTGQDAKGYWEINFATPPEVGQTYRDCKITVVQPFGVFVEVTPGYEALLHITRITGELQESIEEVGLKVGDEVDVTVERKDSKGNFFLSRFTGNLPEVGRTYRDCKVKAVHDFGMFVEVTPGFQALLHISRMSNFSESAKGGNGFQEGDVVDVLVQSKSLQGNFILREVSATPPEVGETYRNCKVTAIHEFGIFVEVTPGYEALLHVSKISGESLESAEKAGFKAGDLIDVSVERQDVNGKFILSRPFNNVPQIGKSYRDCKIKAIHDYGMVVEVTPGYEALLNISQSTGELSESAEEAGPKEGDVIDVTIEGKDANGSLIARQALIAPPQVGKIYRDREITAIHDFGMFVEVTPGIEALLHITRMDTPLASAYEAGLRKGDKIDVKVVREDGKGKFVLSGPSATQPEIGKTYRDCKIVHIDHFGVFVEVTPGFHALLYFADTATEDSAAFKLGDLVDVKVISQDAKGNFRVSRLELLGSISPPEIGKTYRDCRIKTILDYGVIVEVTPGHQGLLHITRFIGEDLEAMEEAGLKEGDMIDVTVEGKDSKGNYRLSKSSAIPPEVGKTYSDCKIKGIHEFGMFVEVTPGYEGLLHISRITSERLESIDEVGFKVGDLINVTVEGRDNTGNFRLSRVGILKGSLPPEIGKTYRDCKIISIHDYGAFVEVTTGHRALLHISQITDDHLESMEESGLKEGDFVDVVAYGKDAKGNFRLRRLGVLGNEGLNVAPTPQPSLALEVGRTYRDCKITGITKYGAFVEVAPKCSSLLHFSETTTEDSAGFKVGDLIDVQVKSQDENGYFRLSRLGLLGLTFPLEIGKTYRDCKIKEVRDIGMFVEVTPGNDALFHVRKLTPQRMKTFKKGDLIDVKVTGRDGKGNWDISFASDLEIGKTYRGCKITVITDYGAFVEVAPGRDALLHFSETTTEDRFGFKVGDLIDVQVKSQDANGFFRLSRLGLLGPTIPPEIGKIYRGCRIIMVENYGVIVEVTPGYQALLHFSRAGEGFESAIKAGYKSLKKGDVIDVKVERQDSKGKFVLSGLSFAQLEVGKIYRDCKIMRIRDFGAFVEVTPGLEALLHITATTAEDSAAFKVGGLIDVKVESQDDKGNFRLSRLDLLGTFAPPEVGKTYQDCKITYTRYYGAFVEVTPGHQALLHISQIPGVDSMEESGLKAGDVIDVTVKNKDEEGKFHLSQLGLVDHEEIAAAPATTSAPIAASTTTANTIGASTGTTPATTTAAPTTTVAATTTGASTSTTPATTTAAPTTTVAATITGAPTSTAQVSLPREVGSSFGSWDDFETYLR